LRLWCLIGWLAALPTLLLAGPPVSAATQPVRWQAVLAAGDMAQPVFDNAITAFRAWLAANRVPEADIHRLSASPDARDPAVEPANANGLLHRIAALHPGPGEGCLVFITSHGQRNRGIFLAYLGETLQPAALAQALAAGCRRSPTVVIVSGCYSGTFAAGPMTAPNRIVMTAARADRPSFGCQVGRTYAVFDECLLASLPASPTWRAVFNATVGCVQQRERALGVSPSQPQASFGVAVRDLPAR
jgi:hypothetical protein